MSSAGFKDLPASAIYKKKNANKKIHQDKHGIHLLHAKKGVL